MDYNSKILVIGGGSIGRRHIKNLQSLGYKNISCLKRKYDEEFEKQWNVRVVTKYPENEDMEAVFVCTPTSLHVDALEKAVTCQAHIFMEKPLIHDRKELAKAESLLKDYDKVFFIGFMLRYHPLVKKIKDIIDSEELGKVYSARFEFGSYLPYWHPYEDYKISYASRKELGGGVILTISHELDLIQYYFGEPAEITGVKRNLAKLNINTEEVYEGIFNYPDKVVSLHLDYLQKDYNRCIKILCDEGKIEWNWHDNYILIKPHKKEEKRIHLDNFDVNELYVEEIKDFFQLINNEQTTHSLDASHALRNTKILFSMHEAADKNQTIKLS